MDIVVISEFSEDFSRSDNDRFLYLTNLISHETGDDIELVTSSFCHTTKKHRTNPLEQWPFKITFIEESGYSKNVCLKRFYSHYSWGKNLLNYLKSREKKPDVIYCAVPSLTGPRLIAKYCEKKNIPFVIDVQDLWPEAFQMVFNVPIVSKLIFWPFEFLANSIYKRADAICAVSNTYCKRAKDVNHKVKDTTSVFIGTELDVFDRYASENQVMRKDDGEIWMAYCGTLGTSYNLPLVFEAMKKIHNPLLRFIVMGDGPLMEQFKSKAKGLNVTFTGRLDYSHMCGMLSACDIVVNPIVGRSVATIINKHADYAACGKPVLNTQKSEEYQILVEKYRMGFNCITSDDVAKNIIKLINDKALRLQMGMNARKCAEEQFDRKCNYLKLVSEIKKVVYLAESRNL